MLTIEHFFQTSSMPNNFKNTLKTFFLNQRMPQLWLTIYQSLCVVPSIKLWQKCLQITWRKCFIILLIKPKWPLSKGEIFSIILHLLKKFVVNFKKGFSSNSFFFFAKLDLKKSFDCVNWKFLLLILKQTRLPRYLYQVGQWLHL